MGSVNIFALESSTPVLGVGLLQVDEQGHQSFIQREFHGSSRHAEHLLPLVDQVLAQAQLGQQDLSAIAFGQGPVALQGYGWPVERHRAWPLGCSCRWWLCLLCWPWPRLNTVPSMRFRW